MSKILQIKHPDIKGQPVTYLNNVADAGDTSLSVANTSAFSTDYVIVGELGVNTAEIVLISAVVDGNTITVPALGFPHTQGLGVVKTPYNQIEISYSEDLETLWNSGAYDTLAEASEAATWVILVTTDITPSQEQTTYKDDSTNSRSYRWRYKNETDIIYSDYENIVLPTGAEENQVSAIFDSALSITNKELDQGSITSMFLFGLLNEGLRKVGMKRKRWSHDQSFGQALGILIAGQNDYILPSGIEKRNTAIAIWNMKIADGRNIDYIDKRAMDVKTANWHTTEVATEITSGSATAVLDSTANLTDSGSVIVFVGTDQMTLTYSANDRSTNTLTLSDAATEVTTTIPVDTRVWQGATFGTPTCFTIYNDRIYFDVVPNVSIHNRTIGGDFYQKIQQVDSLDDYIRTVNVNFFKNFLRWGICMQLNEVKLADRYEKYFNDDLNDLRRTESTGQKQYLKPKSWRQRSVY